MYKIPAAILAIILVCLFGGVWLGISAVFASLAFLVIAVCLSPIAVHKVENHQVAIGLLLALSFFASYPMKRVLGMDDFVLELLLSAVYLGILYVTGFGWRRSWS